MYLVTVADDTMDVKELSEIQTMVFSGITYLVVPAPQTNREPPSEKAKEVDEFLADLKREKINPSAPAPSYRVAKVDDRAEVIKLFKLGTMTVNQISHKLGLGHMAVSNIIREAGFETAADRAKKRIAEVLEDAGYAGTEPSVLSEIAKECGTRVGPILMNMLKAHTVKRLPNGNLAMMG